MYTQALHLFISILDGNKFYSVSTVSSNVKTEINNFSDNFMFGISGKTTLLYCKKLNQNYSVKVSVTKKSAITL